MVRRAVLNTVYKTTNLINGKFYIGVHKTENPDDSYLGSGKLIKLAVAKYGEQSFQKEILFSYLDAGPAFEKEAELVEMYRDNPLCMNLREGGSGGFDWINRNLPHGPQKLDAEKVVEMRRLAVEENKFSKELGEIFNVSPRVVLSILRGTNPSWKKVTGGIPVFPAHRTPKRGNYKKEHCEKISKAQKDHFENNKEARVAAGVRFGKYWRTHKKSAEHLRKLGESTAKRKNQILGRKLMNDSTIQRLVKPEEISLHLSQGWEMGGL